LKNAGSMLRSPGVPTGSFKRGSFFFSYPLFCLVFFDFFSRYPPPPRQAGEKHSSLGEKCPLFLLSLKTASLPFVLPGSGFLVFDSIFSSRFPLGAPIYPSPLRKLSRLSEKVSSPSFPAWHLLQTTPIAGRPLFPPILLPTGDLSIGNAPFTSVIPPQTPPDLLATPTPFFLCLLSVASFVCLFIHLSGIFFPFLKVLDSRLTVSLFPKMTKN